MKILKINQSKTRKSRVRSPTRDDPTRTQDIRDRWSREVDARYGRLAKEIVEYAKAEFDPLTKKKIIRNLATYEYTYDQSKAVEFMAWLQTRIDEIILEGGPSDSWQNKYLTEAYARGLQFAENTVGANITAELLSTAPLTDLQATESLTGLAAGAALSPSVERALGLVIHREAVQLLYARDFAALKGITEAMSAQIARVLADGMDEGVGKRELVARILDRVDKVGVSRSKLLAQTETVRAHQLANINQGEWIKQTTGAEVQYLWITSMDSRVRHSHAERNRKVYKSRATIAPLIGEPNCRCAVQLFFPATDNKERQEGRSRTREKGLKLIDD